MTTTHLSSRLATAAAALALLAAGPAAQAANLITNGSFEDLTHFSPDGNDTNEVNAGDSTTLPGWTVFHTDVSWIGPTNPFSLGASKGDYFLDLSGYHNGDVTGGVQQTFATVAGALYQLTFDLGSSDIHGFEDGVHVVAGDATADFVSTNGGVVLSKWETETLTFKALGSSTTISFQGNLGQNYVGLDNVSVTGATATSGAPEPAAWAMMLVGFGGLGAMVRRRRERVAA